MDCLLPDCLLYRLREFQEGKSTTLVEAYSSSAGGIGYYRSHTILEHTMPSSLLQIFGFFLAVATILLDKRENVLARPLSLVGTIMSLFVYYPAGLYAKCILNGIYIVLNIYGWYQWLYGGKNKTPLTISTMPARQLVILGVLGLLTTGGLGKILVYYSSAELPYWDSLHTMMCVIAQWMLARKKLEAWKLWIVADVLYIPICFYKGLYFFMALRVLYIIMGIDAYRTWRCSYRQASCNSC